MEVVFSPKAASREHSVHKRRPQMCSVEKGMGEGKGAGMMSVRIRRCGCCAGGGVRVCTEHWVENALRMHSRELNERSSG